MFLNIPHRWERRAWVGVGIPYSEGPMPITAVSDWVCLKPRIGIKSVGEFAESVSLDQETHTAGFRPM